ncbi:MAG: hypothetical protein LW698_03995 [Planctomycetaceae bacterium]|jgi:hypothetical protein|nr:hypothetical protein [Planctomycetaceae bacterium]
MPPTVTTAPVSGHRGCVADVAIVARDIPLFPVDRVLRLGPVAEARAAAATRIGWAAVFLKAYGLVARELPVLRTWFVRGLRPRLATSSESVATLAVNRTDGADERLCFARLPRPEALPLAEIQAFVQACTTRPIEEMFKRQLELEMMPGPVRRTILRWNANSTSPKRPSRIGTFSLSTLAGQQAFNRFHPTLCTTSIAYGPLEPDGRCLVTLIADHRVLDGAAAARALERLEAVLTAAVAGELTTARARPGDPREAAA